jgi:hypothetical protein
MKTGTECVAFVTYDQVKNTKSKGQEPLLVRNSKMPTALFKLTLASKMNLTFVLT